jgi:hypothetical protein
MRVGPNLEQDEFKPLLPSFLTQFLKILLSKSHDFLRDEIMGIVWSLISVDLTWFHDVYIAAFLNDECCRMDQAKRGICEGYLRGIRVRAFFFFSLSSGVELMSQGFNFVDGKSLSFHQRLYCSGRAHCIEIK